MKKKIIPAGKLMIHSLITDEDILRDHEEPEPLRVVELEAVEVEGIPCVRIAMVGAHRCEDVLAIVCPLEVRDDD